MNHSLLIIQEAITDSFTSRMADQGFCVVLLIMFAVYSMRRQKQIEDKLEKYMNEDREEMKEVIQNNTKAFDRIANKLTLFLVGCFVFFSGCHSSKVVTSSVSQKDSVAVVSEINVKASVARNKETFTKDTSVTFPERSVKGTFNPLDFKPLFTEAGFRVDNTKYLFGNGITATVTTRPDGNTEIVCKSDSLTMIINSLTREKEEAVFQFDSLSHLRESANSQRSEKQTEIKSSVGFELNNWLIPILIIACILYILFMLYKKKVYL